MAARDRYGVLLRNHRYMRQVQPTFTLNTAFNVECVFMVVSAKLNPGSGVVLYAREMSPHEDFFFVGLMHDMEDVPGSLPGWRSRYYVEIHGKWRSGDWLNTHIRIPMDEHATTWSTKPFVLGIHAREKEQAVCHQTNLVFGIDRDIASNSRLAAWWFRESHPPRWHVGAYLIA